VSVELPKALVGVREVAEYLGVSQDTVYEHADEWGARRIGKGPKARLRFSLVEVDERLRERASCSASRGSESPASPPTTPVRRPRRRRRTGTNRPVVPIRRPEDGSEAA
jgi:excisionase family DNA binding protein